MKRCSPSTLFKRRTCATWWNPRGPISDAFTTPNSVEDTRRHRILSHVYSDSCYYIAPLPVYAYPGTQVANLGVPASVGYKRSVGVRRFSSPWAVGATLCLSMCTNNQNMFLALKIVARAFQSHSPLSVFFA